MCEGASKQPLDLRILPRRDRAHSPNPVLKFLDPPMKSYRRIFRNIYPFIEEKCQNIDRFFIKIEQREIDTRVF